MRFFSAAAIAGTAIFAAHVTGASAADLYGSYGPGSIKDAPYVEAPPVSSRPSWYVRLDGSYAGYDEPDLIVEGLYELYDAEIDNNWSLGGGVGLYLRDGFRADITYDHRFETDVSGKGRWLPSQHDAYGEFGLKSDLFLANLYYDFNPGGRFNPYIGGGLGFVRHETSTGIIESGCGCVGYVEGLTKTDVAAAVMAGVTIDLLGGRKVVTGGSIKDGPVYSESGPSRLMLDIGYRFLYLGEAETGPTHGPTPDDAYEDPTIEKLHAHELRMGLRYNIN